MHLRHSHNIPTAQDIYPCFNHTQLEKNITITHSFFGIGKYRNTSNKLNLPPSLLPKKYDLNISKLHYNWHLDPKSKINLPSPKPHQRFTYVIQEDTENKPFNFTQKVKTDSDKSLVPQKSFANIEITHMTEEAHQKHLRDLQELREFQMFEKKLSTTTSD